MCSARKTGVGECWSFELLGNDLQSLFYLITPIISILLFICKEAWKRHSRDRVTLKTLLTRWSCNRPCHSLSHSLDTSWHVEWKGGHFDGWIYQGMSVKVLLVARSHNRRWLLSSLWDILLTIHKTNRHLDQKLDVSRYIPSNILSFSLLNSWRYHTSSAVSQKITERFKSRYALET